MYPHLLKKRNPQIRHKLNYVSYDEEDPIVLELTENNYKELAFTYLNWKNGGYKECKNCGRLFKTKKEGNQLYCKKCAPKYKKIEYKVIKCIDCGTEVWINSKDTETCRCEDCNFTYQRERNAKKNRAYRDRNKNKS